MSTKYLIESVPANVDRRVEVKCRGDGFRKLYKWLAGADEAFTDRGRKDLRAIYGLHARTMIGWLNPLQHAPRDPRDRADPFPSPRGRPPRRNAARVTVITIWEINHDYECTSASV
jgi:hypothetical protein